MNPTEMINSEKRGLDEMIEETWPKIKRPFLGTKPHSIDHDKVEQIIQSFVEYGGISAFFMDVNKRYNGRDTLLYWALQIREIVNFFDQWENLNKQEQQEFASYYENMFKLREETE